MLGCFPFYSSLVYPLFRALEAFYFHITIKAQWWQQQTDSRNVRYTVQIAWILDRLHSNKTLVRFTQLQSFKYNFLWQREISFLILPNIGLLVSGAIKLIPRGVNLRPLGTGLTGQKRFMLNLIMRSIRLPYCGTGWKQGRKQIVWYCQVSNVNP